MTRRLALVANLLLSLASAGAEPMLRGVGKTPLYVVLRMDDVQYGWNTEVQASIVEWALNHTVKMNLGIISGPDPNGVTWPTTCATSPTDKNCDDPVVQAVYKAYNAGRVRSAAGVADDPEATLELFNHGWDHDGWPTLSDKGRSADMVKSAGALRSAFPAASIQTFVPPENIANAATVCAVAANNMSIISSMGTLACQADPPNPGVAPRYNYQYAPCQGVSAAWSEPADLLLPRPRGGGSSGGDDPWFCIPPNDIYDDLDGFKKLPDCGGQVRSVPTGSANTPTNYVTTGLPAAEVLGADACGCVNTTCAAVASAVNNAAKSNGLHWTVLMMHPQTVFCEHGTSTGDDPAVCPASSGAQISYVTWLDAFVAAAAALDTYDVRFVHFQDLVATKAPLAPTPTPTHACAGDYKQCGGAGWTSACCSADFTCVSDGSGYYSQCQPAKEVGTTD